EKRQRSGGHRLVVKHDEMADDTLLRIEERHAKITHRAHVDHALVFWKDLREPVRNVTNAALRHFHAGRAGEGVLEVLAKIILLPKSQRAGAQIRQALR